VTSQVLDLIDATRAIKPYLPRTTGCRSWTSSATHPLAGHPTRHRAPGGLPRRVPRRGLGQLHDEGHHQLTRASVCRAHRNVSGDAGSLTRPWSNSVEGRQAARICVGPAGAKGSPLVSMCQMASVSRRAISTRATLAPRWRRGAPWWPGSDRRRRGGGRRGWRLRPAPNADAWVLAWSARRAGPVRRTGRPGGTARCSRPASWGLEPGDVADLRGDGGGQDPRDPRHAEEQRHVPMVGALPAQLGLDAAIWVSRWSISSRQAARSDAHGSGKAARPGAPGCGHRTGPRSGRDAGRRSGWRGSGSSNPPDDGRDWNRNRAPFPMGSHLGVW
jgi:hypothetical protein